MKRNGKKVSGIGRFDQVLGMGELLGSEDVQWRRFGGLFGICEIAEITNGESRYMRMQSGELMSIMTLAVIIK